MDDRFLEGFVGLYAGPKEILVGAYFYHTVVVRSANRFCSRQCRGAVYLYDLLVKAPPVLMLLLFALVAGTWPEEQPNDRF